MRSLGGFQFEGKYFNRSGGVLVELATGAHACNGHFAGSFGLVPAGVHGTQRKAAARAYAPELFELKDFTVAVNAINASSVGNHHGVLAGLIRVVFLFLG